MAKRHRIHRACGGQLKAKAPIAWLKTAWPATNPHSDVPPLQPYSADLMAQTLLGFRDGLLEGDVMPSITQQHNDAQIAAISDVLAQHYGQELR